jgi:hypothetical protein
MGNRSQPVFEALHRTSLMNGARAPHNFATPLPEMSGKQENRVR